jgi:hypothetical protein
MSKTIVLHVLPVLVASMIGVALVASPAKTAVQAGTPVAWGSQSDVPAGLTDVVDTAAGSSHNLALKGDGTVVAWGDNSFGQLNVPAGLTNVVDVAAGNLHSVALKSDGTVVAWGNNSFGQLNVPAGLTNVVEVSAGNTHTLALKSDGTVVAWGENNTGQLNVPVGLTNVVDVDAGTYHSLALKDDGTVVAWGSNNFGQLNVPAGLTNVVEVAGGQAHSLALKSDGTVVAWGSNSLGQLNVPAGLTGVVDIAAGSGHSLALKSDGTVVAWGNNFDGQSNVPAGLTNVFDVDAGDFHSLALKQVPDSTAPTVSSINRANSNPSNATDDVEWKVTFSENVSGVDTGDFALANNGLDGSPEISGVTQGANASVYTVTASTGSGSGTLGLDLVDNDSIKDGANNLLGGTGSSNGDLEGEAYTLDRTAPTVTAAAVKGSDFTDTYAADTWTNKDVRVAFTCADAGGSNLTAGSGDQQKDFTTETSGTTATFDGTCADNAGNTAAASTFGLIKIDKTAPTVSTTAVKLDSNGNPAGSYTAGEWTNKAVKVSWSCTDAASGPVNANDSQTVSTEGASGSVTPYCEDQAGNIASGPAFSPIKIDTSAPSLSDLGPTTQPNTAGWYKTDVTNTFKATDSLGSGLNGACKTAFPANQAGNNIQSKTTTGEGSALKVTSNSCTDVAGNTAPGIDSASFKIDKTAPTVIGLQPAADAKDVSRGTNVVATFSEQMQKSTLTNLANFKLYKVTATGPIQITNVTVTPNLAGTKATLNPYGSSTTLLAKNTRYKAVLTVGVKDLAANALAANKVWYFRTVS